MRLPFLRRGRHALGPAVTALPSAPLGLPETARGPRLDEPARPVMPVVPDVPEYLALLREHVSPVPRDLPVLPAPLPVPVPDLRQDEEPLLEDDLLLHDAYGLEQDLPELQVPAQRAPEALVPAEPLPLEPLPVAPLPPLVRASLAELAPPAAPQPLPAVERLVLPQPLPPLALPGLDLPAFAEAPAPEPAPPAVVPPLALPALDLPSLALPPLPPMPVLEPAAAAREVPAPSYRRPALDALVGLIGPPMSFPADDAAPDAVSAGPGYLPGDGLSWSAQDALALEALVLDLPVED